MRKLLVAALLGVVAIAVGTASATPLRAHLTIASQNPIVVAGSGFAKREHVRVTVRTDVAVAKNVVATRRGTFRVTFSDVSRQDRCSGVSVRAVGSRGTLALAKLPQPMCMPQRAP
jgi:hypothetical protein